MVKQLAQLSFGVMEKVIAGAGAGSSMITKVISWLGVSDLSDHGEPGLGRKLRSKSD